MGYLRVLYTVQNLLVSIVAYEFYSELHCNLNACQICTAYTLICDLLCFLWYYLLRLIVWLILNLMLVTHCHPANQSNAVA